MEPLGPYLRSLSKTEDPSQIGDFEEGDQISQLAEFAILRLFCWLVAHDRAEWPRQKAWVLQVGRVLDYALQRQERLRQLATMPYEEYLASPEWRRRATELKQLWPCRACGANERLHVHHFTYDRRGHESQDDLVVLCANHHAAIHAGTLHPYRDELGFLRFASEVADG